jgi:hypothetical protein
MANQKQNSEHQQCRQSARVIFAKCLTIVKQVSDDHERFLEKKRITIIPIQNPQAECIGFAFASKGSTRQLPVINAPTVRPAPSIATLSISNLRFGSLSLGSGFVVLFIVSPRLEGTIALDCLNRHAAQLSSVKRACPQDRDAVAALESENVTVQSIQDNNAHHCRSGLMYLLIR